MATMNVEATTQSSEELLREEIGKPPAAYIFLCNVSVNREISKK